MKTKYLIILLLIGVVVISGCIQQQKLEGKKPAEDTGKKISLGMEFDYVMTPSVIESMHVWIEGKKWRREQTISGKTTIDIFDGNSLFTYLYDPATEKYIKAHTVINHTAKSVDPTSVDLKALAPYVVGKEIIDDKPTTVVEYATTPSAKIKMWVWDEKGVPLKTQTIINNKPVITIEYKNFIFGNIPDEIFETPDDIVIQMPTIPTKK